MNDASAGLENVQLYSHASVGLVPVRSDKWQLHYIELLPMTRPFSPESPLAIPEKMETSVGRLGSCHLYPRPGRARRKILHELAPTLEERQWCQVVTF